MNHFFGLPNFTLSNYERLISDGIGGYWNSAVITVLSLIVVAFIRSCSYSIARNMSKKSLCNYVFAPDLRDICSSFR